SCCLTHLETHVLGIAREGDVPGSEIPGIYFDYLRSGDARGLQPVFFHNALDIVTLAALTVEMARVVHECRVAGDNAQDNGPVRGTDSIDLFSLSRMFERSDAEDLAFSACARALELGLPETVEPRALCHLATHHKRRGDFASAEKVWLELSGHETLFALQAYRELAIHYERRQRDLAKALHFTEQAIALLTAAFPAGDGEDPRIGPFTRRRERLQKRLAAE
ncbi:MAG: ribonuclease H-like domain-containing protein, partial [Terriglobia bacterium]